MTPSTRWGHKHGSRRRAVRPQSRRLSKRVTRHTSPDRVRQMLAGSPTACTEVADFNFALIATQFRRDEFRAKIRRMKRRGTRSLLVVGMVLVTLNFLLCMAYAVFSLTLEAAPL